MISNLLQELAESHDMLILLSDLTGKMTKELAAIFLEFDLILSSDRSLGKMAPIEIGNVLMTQTSSRGKYIGQIDISWENGNRWYNDRLPTVADLEKRSEGLSKQIRYFESLEESKSSKKVDRLKKQRQRIDADIAARLKLEDQLNDEKPNRHKVSFLPVRPAKSPADVEEIVVEIENLI